LTCGCFDTTGITKGLALGDATLQLLCLLCLLFAHHPIHPVEPIRKTRYRPFGELDPTVSTQNQLNSPPNLQSSAFSTNPAAKALRSVNSELLQSFVQDRLERFIVAILVKNRVSLMTTI